MPSYRKNRLHHHNVGLTLHNVQLPAFICHTSAIPPLYHRQILTQGPIPAAGK